MRQNHEGESRGKARFPQWGEVGEGEREEEEEEHEPERGEIGGIETRVGSAERRGSGLEWRAGAEDG
jgi:hypothetical protein